jgi:outer membrane biosynthesis protein TonB
MPKLLTRSLFAALLVLTLFAASSAFAAARSRPERVRAEAHRAGARTGRRVNHAHKAAHRSSHHRRTSSTRPVTPPSPIKPVSPVEPTPPIMPVETTPPPVTPTPPVETASPTAPVETAPTPPAPTPPTASFTFAPASPAAGQAATLDGANSTCADGRCTYAWSDDGGPTQPIPAQWSLGSGQSLSFTFLEAGTKYVRLVVTDAAGQAATVEHNIVVAEPAKEEKASEEKAREVKTQEEKAKELKAQEEKAQEEAKAQEKKASEEKASEEKASEEKAKEVKAQEEKAKELKAQEEAKAREKKASEEKASEEKAKEVKAQEEKAKELKAQEEKAAEEKAKEEKAVTPTGCFENPEAEGTSRFEACGYPGPKNTGVAETSGKTECSSLPEYTGSKTISTAGTTIEGKELKYTLPAYLAIDASNVTLKNDCFVLKGEASSESAIILGSSVKGVTIEHTTIRGENSTTQSFEVAIKSFSGPKVVVKDDRLEDCAECIQGSAEITGSYLLANRELGNTGLHRETVYMNTGSGNGEVAEETVIARNSTFLVPEASVAIVFANTGNGVYNTDPCGSHITLEDNLLAGSGQMVQQCGSRSEKGSATLAFKGNRVARCLTTPIKNNASGMPNCSGSYFEGADSHGYFPYGGSLSVQDDRTNGPTGSSYAWEGNFWDNNLAAIAAPAS